ncbi:MAG: hypothetical protein Q9168_002302 [Polycauliona sp. 1 TL-2023]
MSPSPSQPPSPLRSTSFSQHQPSTPSRLKHSHAPGSPSQDELDSPIFQTPASRLPPPLYNLNSDQRTDPPDHSPGRPSPNPSPLRPRHWRDYSTHNCSQPEGEPCQHGSLSPEIRPSTPKSTSSTLDDDRGFGGRYARSQSIEGGPNGLLGDAVGDTLFGDGRFFSNDGGSESHDDEHGKEQGWSGSWNRFWRRSGGGDRKYGGAMTMSTTRWLATKHGVPNKRRMYLVYYFPFLQWITQYRWAFLQGDLIAALTMASFYIPMSLSYASNLGHIPPINGLYSFVFNPLLYALLGSCPQMVVGPEAAGSLLLGAVVKASINTGHSGEEDNDMNARIAGVVTGIAGAVIFIAGLTRLGFLDSVLSRPFLRGFISAIGFVIFVDQLVPEMGLDHVAKVVGGVSHGSSLDKVIFLIQNVDKAHHLTCAVAFGSFAVIMVCRELKRRLQPRIPSIAYVPDRFIIVVLSAILTGVFRWDKKGLEILGDVKSSTGSPFAFRFPFIPSHMQHVREAMSTSFLIALLGFFESSVAAKSLGGGERKKDGLQGMSLSANRELVALGVANIVGGCFMALPAFGGYGRSKVNVSTGGRTPMSSVFLSIITIICILFLLPYFYYLPKAVLSSMISVVAYSLIEEAPHDITFFLHIRAYPELFLMSLIFLSTVFYSLSLGIALGIGLSLLSVVRHATKPRIQILGKVPGSHDQFENAETSPNQVEFVDGCLIVKIPEPLTFANTGDLKGRLRRLELYGTTTAHPALPRVRNPEHNSNIIFDIHGVTGLDGSGTQVLSEIVESYVSRGVRVFFCRCPKEGSTIWRLFEKSGIVDRCGGRRHFVSSVEEALRMAEMESLSGL